MKKTSKYIHLWLSLPAGIMISIICFTGAILVFKEELLTYMGYENIRDSPLMGVMKLHRWLMDDTRTVGKVIVGISTLFFIFILISGMVACWPKKWKKRHFTVRQGRTMRQTLYNLHTVLGLYAGIILLVCALTGLMWSFQWYRDLVGFIFDAEVQRGAPIWKVVRSLHFGDYAGWFSKTLTFIAAIIGGLLPITGYWMYIDKKMRTRKRSYLVSKEILDR
ncbi:PepSY domain-containing protein [Bacteroides sp.]|uniref:PepSY-associated TM helix domain-containing protein n=1 Tax=Bacteroides sp. TaxID=29523 RepID=UPI001B797F76|nr:PepSY-associated TM helix domain-containing protein [Bacteroides sp.]MBP6065113.1 PepSY domain-containing protein [Bacteroides sp.]MBP6066877.1 PepSY domain-containing protein [Bacteroides sp.]MBP6936193.1 PepSY domain-containing protein [Bacteroides sp.]MBP8622361.1 PepSY domain-containing protein [Bacteroides sp.]MBP9586096.1 PepSY domain-containing protein [Bacteroides sp.]